MLSPQARRLAVELADAIEQGDAALVVALVDGSGLHREQRLEVCRILDRTAVPETVLRFDRFDKARLVAA